MVISVSCINFRHTRSYFFYFPAAQCSLDDLGTNYYSVNFLIPGLVNYLCDPSTSTRTPGHALCTSSGWNYSCTPAGMYTVHVSIDYHLRSRQCFQPCLSDYVCVCVCVCVCVRVCVFLCLDLLKL